MRPVVGAVVLASLLATGCGPDSSSEPSKLKVGTVDIMRAMEERPETVQIRLEWAAQAGSTYLEMSGVANKEQYAALKAQVDQRSAAWQKRMVDFMNDSIKQIDKSASTVAKERGLDIVLVDNAMTKPVKFTEGDDITLDVMVEMQKGN